MRSKTYGDKQRDAQQRKKQEELRKKINPGGAPASETTDADKSSEPQSKTTKDDTPDRRSA